MVFKGRNEHNLLYLSYIKHHKPVSSTTIVKWVKEVLSLVAIDTSTFSARSNRSAPSSAPARAGLALSDIMEAADWLSRKPTHKSDFAHGVLNSNTQH